MLNKIIKLMFITVFAGILSTCAGSGSSSQTPYDTFKSALHVLKNPGKVARTRVERSPLIHKDIYARSDKDKLIYFYQGRDQNSINFTRTLKEYADKSWLQVEAYTLDHRSLMEFPGSEYASPEIIAQYFGSETPDFKTPVLFLQQHDAHTVQVSVGNISLMQLVNKMNQIAENRNH
jgi:hypothetical protein